MLLSAQMESVPNLLELIIVDVQCFTAFFDFWFPQMEPQSGRGTQKSVRFCFAAVRQLTFVPPEDQRAPSPCDVADQCFDMQLRYLEERFMPLLVDGAEVKSREFPVEELLHAAAEELSLPLVPTYRAVPLLESVLRRFTFAQEHLRVTPKYDTRHDHALHGIMQFILRFRGARATSRLRFLCLDETVLSVLAILSRDLVSAPFTPLFRDFTKVLVRSLEELWPTHSPNGVRLLCCCLYFGCTLHCKPQTTEPALWLMYRYVLCHRPLSGCASISTESHWEENTLIVLASFVHLLATPSGQQFSSTFLEAIPRLPEVVESKFEAAQRMVEQHNDFSLAGLLHGSRSMARWLRCEDRYDGGFSSLMMVSSSNQLAEEVWRNQLQRALGGPEIVSQLLSYWTDELG